MIDSGATVVIRPDSGEPVEVVSKVTNLLAAKFGVEENSKGFKVLKNVRVIQGDGVNPNSIAEILEDLTSQGFSASNIAFGMGGALLQKVDRDTLKFAFKCSAIERNKIWHDVYKDPITDTGKRSKRGRLDLVKEDAENGKTTYRTIRTDDLTRDGENPSSAMRIVYQGGELYNAADDTLDMIRKRAGGEFK